MAFTPVTYNTGAGPGLDGPAFNAMQTQYSEAILSFEQDLFTPFVFSGLVATKDGTTPSQLDVTAGVAFLTQSDLTERRQAPTSTTFSTSGHPSTTMYLFLKNDGTYSWQTSSTGPTNSLAIAQVTTDGSSNINTVTDKRPLNTTLLSGMGGTMSGPAYKTGTNGFFQVPVDTTSFNVTALRAGPDAHSISDWMLISLQNGGFTLYDNHNSRNLWIANADGSLSLPNGAFVDHLGNVFGGGLYLVGANNTAQISLDTSGHFMNMWCPTPAGTPYSIDFHPWTGSSNGAVLHLDGATGLVHVYTNLLSDHDVTASGTLWQGSQKAAVSGSHSAGQTIISYCTGGPPASLAANEICVQLS